MRRSLLVIFLILSIVSCRQHLVVSEIRSENISNYPVDFLPDSDIISLIQPFKDVLVEDMSEVISFSTEEISKHKPESKLTNYLSDLLLEEGKAFCRSYNYTFRPDVAYMNYGGIRSSLPRGEITVGNVFELMPFENELVIIEIAGEDLRKFAEHIAKIGGDAIAGVMIGIKDGNIADFKVNGAEVVMSKSYYLVTNDYVANGGDDIVMFKNRKRYIPTGFKIRDLIIRNMRRNYAAGVKIEATLDGRIYYE
ncbi:5'-nucleotidase C-terminal domain-containing protein [Sunxiuqinia sp. A32]|uniref:5'-nucleotidase C-terminal domain-containing protein n=1 Tax=Sunxiuqinia sp. A32 TaxID=3461496 RepID=UPI00404525F6